MKRSLTSIPQLYRNIKRWTEIVSVLSRYGLGNWISRFKIDSLRDALRLGSRTSAKLTTEARIRMALADLGPTFIKLGQLLSTRPDLVGPKLAEELTKLQQNTPTDSFEDVKRTIETEQGRPLEELFAHFDEEPIASASIGQVHRARLHTGEEVVVKVRHKGIEKIVETDLDILSGLAHLANRIDDFKNYQPPAIIAEMSRMMRRELDLEREYRNIVQFRQMLRKEKSVRIPEPFGELSSSRMLTMEYLDCVPVSEVAGATSDKSKLTKLAKQSARLYLRMIFEEGFYHADPHPGNIVLTNAGVIGLLDFGMVGRISEDLRENIETMLTSIVSQDVPMLVTLIRRVGVCPGELNESQFSNDVADFVGQYSTQELSRFDTSSALNDFMEIVRRYNIILPSEASVLIKVLVSLEGTIQLLNPEFSLMEVMRPFQRMMIVKRLSPARQAKKMRRFYLRAEQLVESLPTRVSNILEQIQSGRFDVHLVHRRLGPTVNRLVVGLMTSAVFLGSSWMVSSNVPPMTFTDANGEGGVSLLGMTGLIVSMLMGLRLLWAIRKSGNLDQPE